jgi:hypothetical protein
MGNNYLLATFNLIHHVGLLPKQVLPIRWVWCFWSGKLRIPNLVTLIAQGSCRQAHPVTFWATVGPTVKQ